MIYDIAIIGGGIVGASILNKLVSVGQKKVILLEKESDLSTGASKANSGLVHAGFDCKPNTLKAKLNVRGNYLYEELCKRLKLSFVRCGAMVVGTDMKVVKELYERGIKNGVKGLKILSSNNEIKKYNKNINEDITCGLYAKTAGLINPYLFTIALGEEAIINGGEVLLEFDVDKIKKTKEGYIISSKEKSIIAKKIINCAGTGYNKIAKLLEVENYPIKLVRGEYYLLDSSEIGLSKLTVFPLPSNLGKGVLITPTIDGNILIGPTAIDGDESKVTTYEGLSSVKEKAKLLIKDIPFNKTIREFSGIRTISGDDFIIEQSKIDSNVINVCGICSPGLSSAPAIAEMIVCDILKYKNIEVPLKSRAEIVSIKGKTVEELNELISKDSSYGEIVCKCEMISKKEVLEAINSPLKPKSFDAIKRRTRVGMGRCQSGFCLLKVVELIAKERKIPVEEVLKEYNNSNILLKDIDSTHNYVHFKSNKNNKSGVSKMNQVKLETVKSVSRGVK